MGCVASRIDNEERVRICKERKRVMKQLLGFRREFSDAQVAYLRSLRNTGVTLRQFTESESLELDETASNAGFPPSPPPPLPPSPPPPPSFSPESNPNGSHSGTDENTETDEDSVATPPPPPINNPSWEYWDLFGSALPQCEKSSEEENWADTNTEFLEEEEGEATDEYDDQVSLIPRNNAHPPAEILVDDSSSMVSSTDMAMVVWRSKKTLSGVVKDLDEYFLKASAVVKDIAVFIDIEAGGTFIYQSGKENKRKRSNPAKVFSALTWSWSSRSLQPPKETTDFHGSNEPCKPGAHCVTLQKLYTEERKLYKDVKEEETAKVEYGRKSLLLQRQQEEHDWAKVEKTRSTHENLEAYISSLQESIERSRLTILELVNKELHPQLITLASGMMHMWQTMHNCHEIQSHISQHLNHLTDHQQIVEPTSESHQQAAAQLQTEVASWYHSFCKLVKFQREYVRALCKWTELTRYLGDVGIPQNSNSSAVHTLVKKWQHALDNLPDKMVSESIKHLLSAIHSIVVQQQEECSMRKRTERLARKLERELALLSEMEMRFSGSLSLEETSSVLTPNHPLTIRRAKVESLRVSVEGERVKYMSCVKKTWALILNNLQTRLPNVFQELTVFSSAYSQSFEGIFGIDTVSEGGDARSSPVAV